MQLFIELSNLKTLVIDINEYDTIYYLKEKIETIVNIPIKYQNILSRSCIYLNNNKLISDYNIKKETTLILKLKN